ncbi:MAG: hypothetical protein WC763_06290 [Candidatus Paceibacterota bacterium]
MADRFDMIGNFGSMRTMMMGEAITDVLPPSQPSWYDSFVESSMETIPFVSQQAAAIFAAIKAFVGENNGGMVLLMSATALMLVIGALVLYKAVAWAFYGKGKGKGVGSHVTPPSSAAAAAVAAAAMGDVTTNGSSKKHVSFTAAPAPPVTGSKTHVSFAALKSAMKHKQHATAPMTTSTVAFHGGSAAAAATTAPVLHSSGAMAHMKRMFMCAMIYTRVWLIQVKCAVMHLIHVLVAPVYTIMSVLKRMGKWHAMESVLVFDACQRSIAALQGGHIPNTPHHVEIVCKQIDTVCMVCNLSDAHKLELVEIRTMLRRSSSS